MYNFPEIVRVAGYSMTPTRLRFPSWCRGLTLKQSLRSFRIKSVEVSEISSQFDKGGLLRSPLMEEVSVALDPNEILEEVATIHPVDGKEIVEWMHTSMAENAVLQARIAEYNRAGITSYATGNATDPRYPGLVVDDSKIKNDSGHTVRRRGYAIAMTPRGNYNVPFPRKATGVFKDHLTWGSCSAAGAIQWNASLLKWRRLAETPIRQKIGFYMDGRGNVAPHFFAQIPTLPKPRCTIVQRFSSNKEQNIKLTFRDPTDYTRVLGTKVVAVPPGTNEVTTTVTGFPYVPPTTSEVQPTDGAQTTIELYTVE